MALLMAGCRRFNAEPTARPTLTSTPRSTALPPIPTAVPLGSEDNPIHMKLVQPASTRTGQAVRNAAASLEEALLEDTGLTVQVEVVDSEAEALAALCESPEGTLSVAWLSGLAYAAAHAQDCGSAVLQVLRGERANAEAGDEALIIVNRELELNAVGDLAENTFCRLGFTDLYSWLIPSLMLSADGVSADALESITDYDDPEALIAAVAEGDCDAAGISARQFEEAASATIRTRVRPLDESAAIPYSVLMYPDSLPLGEREALTTALIAIGNGSRSGMLSPLLAQDELVAVSDDDFASLRQFINRAGINLAQAGT